MTYLPTVIILTATGMPAFLLAARSLRRAARRLDRILTEELAESTPVRDGQLLRTTQ
ncbi:hypothetical protein [Actinokineospora sp. HUAS TT18]|uniref:hypothetical protein n=1 Tax=Actinokineospora sp. HUAS TT18 TaxID=3447451 RepID=UPI003F526772